MVLDHAPETWRNPSSLAIEVDEGERRVGKGQDVPVAATLVAEGHGRGAHGRDEDRDGEHVVHSGGRSKIRLDPSNDGSTAVFEKILVGVT